MILAKGRLPWGLITLLEIVGSVPEIISNYSLWYWSYYSNGVRGFMSQLVPIDLFVKVNVMSGLNKIFYMDRDRALEIIWKLDSEYDCIASWFPDWPYKHSYIKKNFNYYRFKNWLKYEEWLLVQMYFLTWYRADKIIEKLKTEPISLK